MQSVRLMSILFCLVLSSCSNENVPYDADLATRLMCIEMPEVADLDFLGTNYYGTGPDYMRRSVFAFKNPDAWDHLILEIKSNICDSSNTDSCGCWYSGNEMFRFVASERQRSNNLFMDAELSLNYHLLIIREVHW